MAQIIELIITHETIGKGIDEDVSRVETTLWTKDGKQVASFDHWTQDSWFDGNAVGSLDGEIKKMFDTQSSQHKEEE